MFVQGSLTVAMPIVGPMRCKTNGVDDHDKAWSCCELLVFDLP